MEDTRLPKCVMFAELMRCTGCVGGQEKEWVGCFLDGLRAFGINVNQSMTAAQNEGEWCRTAEQGAERFMVKWIAAEKVRAGLQHAVVCPNVTGRTKESLAQSKRARAGSPAIADQPQVARTCILQADIVLSFSGATFVLFCFVTTVSVLFRLCFFLLFYFLGHVAFSEYFFGTITIFSLHGKYVVRFPLQDGVFLPCDHGLDFWYQHIICENSINQSKIIYTLLVRLCVSLCVSFRNRRGCQSGTWSAGHDY